MGFGKRAAVPDGPEARREPRRLVAMHVTARTIDGEPVDIAIEDLSTGGFRAIIPLPLREGMLLRVRLPNGRSPHARVVRIEQDHAGCEFIAPMDAESLHALLALS